MNNYAIGAIRDLQKFYYGGRIIGTSFEKYEGRTYHDGELWNPDFALWPGPWADRALRSPNPVRLPAR